jgi:hypothetical protein
VTLYVRHFLTHAEYDWDDWKDICCKPRGRDEHNLPNAATEICSSSDFVSACPSADIEANRRIDPQNQKRSRAEDDLLELLATLVEQYEVRQGYAVPELSPRDRLATEEFIAE